MEALCLMFLFVAPTLGFLCGACERYWVAVPLTVVNALALAQVISWLAS